MDSYAVDRLGSACVAPTCCACSQVLSLLHQLMGLSEPVEACLPTATTAILTVLLASSNRGRVPPETVLQSGRESNTCAWMRL
jgi:hypothetical protein